MTPDGRFLYISERTGSTLAAFSVDGASGKLSYLSSAPTERQPRGFAIDPKGRYLVATGEKSETISVYAIDPAAARSELLTKYPTGKGANWVEIVGFDMRPKSPADAQRGAPTDPGLHAATVFSADFK